MQGADYNKLERNEAKRIGAKQHKNSGRNMVKGDMSNDTFVIENIECSFIACCGRYEPLDKCIESTNNANGKTLPHYTEG